MIDGRRGSSRNSRVGAIVVVVVNDGISLCPRLRHSKCVKIAYGCLGSYVLIVKTGPWASHVGI